VRVLEEGKADLVAIARQHLADPEWARKVAEGRVDDIRPCLHCNEGCAGNLDKDWRVGCDVNPAVGHEVAYAIKQAPKRKKVLVAGGGPAGMEAARMAALRGHQVILFEKSDQLGGLLNYAGVPDFKDDIRRYRRYLVGQMKKQWVEIRLGQGVTPELVQEYNPDAVIVATGAQPKAVEIPIAPGARVLQALEVLGAPVPEGRSAVVIGGGRVGVEIALYLAGKGKKVVVVEMLPDWACDTAGVNKAEMIEKLEALDVPVLTNTAAKAIRTDGVEVVTNGEEKLLAADFVVTALGFSPDPTLAQELEGIVPEVYSIGDLNGGTRIWGATHDAWRVARTI
jgi:NADPH-dependent 2,4-dienoyl-CoA reductase/sulfur reductase-like enzyme